MSERPDPMPNKNTITPRRADAADNETIEEPPPTSPDDNASHRTTTSQPRPRHMRKPSSGSQGGGGSSRSLTGSGKVRRASPATQPGIRPYIPRPGQSGVAVKEALAVAESGNPPPSNSKFKSSALVASASRDTLVTATTESFDDYMARKRQRMQDLEGGGEAPPDDRFDEEVVVDPYAHLRNQSRRPRPEADSTLSPVTMDTMDLPFEVVATPVYDDGNDQFFRDGGRKSRNPLKDWRVLLCLAVALSAIVGLTVALLMQNDVFGNDTKELSTPDGGNINGGGGGGTGSIGDGGFPTGSDPSADSPKEPDDSPVSDGGILEPEGTNSGDGTGEGSESEATGNGSGVVAKTSKPTYASTLAPTSEPTNEPTDEPTSEPTNEPTSDPTRRPTSKSPTDKPTFSPSKVPTEKPTLAPSVRPTMLPTSPTDPGGFEFEVNPFTMLIMSSSDIDDDALLGVTVTHLAVPLQEALPNFEGMRLNLSLDLTSRAGRRLRNLQNYKAYIASFTGRIILRDTDYPTSEEVQSVFDRVFSGANLEDFMEAMDDAKINVAAIIVKDKFESIIGSNDSDNVFGPSQGVLKTPLSNRFTRPGAMFNVAAKDFPVTITSLDVHIESTGNNIPIEVWTKAGSYVNYESDSEAWSPHNKGVPYIIPTGYGVGKWTPIPKEQFETFTIPAGETVGFYITLQDGKGMLLGQASSLGSTPEDKYLQISSAISVGFRFGQTNKDRAWGGAIRYGITL